MKQYNLLKWMLMTEDQVFDKFMSLPNAKSIGSGDQRSLYIPGTRDDRVLLVSHADTVWDDMHLNIGYHNGRLFSKDTPKAGKKGGTYRVGIGADDRAGCAMLWHLRDLGHSILITAGEESGCIGSTFLMGLEDIGDILNNDHQFAIQFDRRGHSDLVFYDVGTNEFVEYCEAMMPNYREALGSYTDIVEVCTTMCGVNISTGYYDEHTGSETLIYPQWVRTFLGAQRWLKQPNIPEFDHPPSYGGYYGLGGGGGGAYYDDYDYDAHYDDYGQSSGGTSTNTKPAPRNDEDALYIDYYARHMYLDHLENRSNLDEAYDFDAVIAVEPDVICPRCNESIDAGDWARENYDCPVCGLQL